MNPQELAQSIGLHWPTPAYLFGVLIFSLVGMVAWRHGRRTERPTAKWLGLALMLYPYVVPQTWLMYLVGTALSVWLYFAWN